MIKILQFSFVFAGILLAINVTAQNDRTSLPAWFTRVENYNRINSAIGISSPNSDTTKAIEEAKLNALLNYSLLHNGIFTSLTNVGLGNQEQTHRQSTTIEYILFTAIAKGKLPSINSLKVKEKFITAYNEAIVLVELDNSPEIDSISAEYTITRRAGFQKENNAFPLFADELDIQILLGDSMLLNKSIVKDGNKFSLIDNSKTTMDKNGNRIMYIYPAAGSSENLTAAMPATLNYGLWPAFIFNLMDQISIFNSMDINLQFKLSTSNTANVSSKNQGLSFQQLVYSLKNIQAKKLDNAIKSLSISGNSIHLTLKSGQKNEQPTGLSLNKTEKKQLKNLTKENWKYLGDKPFEQAWTEAQEFKKDKDHFIFAESEMKAASLQSGIIEGIQLAKLYISSQLATKINALAKTDVSQDDLISVKSAKLINVEKTGEISPFYVFYQNPAPSIYNIKIVLLYKLAQLE